MKKIKFAGIHEEYGYSERFIDHISEVRESGNQGISCTKLCTFTYNLL